MKIKIILFSLAFVAASAFTIKMDGSKLMTKNGKVSFLSDTELEDIKGDNNKASSILDTKTGKVVIEVLIKSFAFKKALLEEHFNENYMESGKYPKSRFEGKIDNIGEINFSKDGTYNANVSGNLTIKDKTNPVTTKGLITVKAGKVNGKANFMVVPQDYNIEIPSLVKDKIAKEIQVSVDLDYEPMK